MRIHECPFCQEKVKIKKVECLKCGVSFEGEFYSSPIMALSEEQQQFIELFVLYSGRLKEMAEIHGVTYPTIRARLDQVIDALKVEINKKGDYKKQILDKVEEGKITPEKAAQIIKNL
jgi:hypothetical protein